MVVEIIKQLVQRFWWVPLFTVVLVLGYNRRTSIILVKTVIHIEWKVSHTFATLKLIDGLSMNLPVKWINHITVDKHQNNIIQGKFNIGRLLMCPISCGTRNHETCTCVIDEWTDNSFPISFPKPKSTAIFLFTLLPHSLQLQTVPNRKWIEFNIPLLNFDRWWKFKSLQLIYILRQLDTPNKPEN